MCTVCGSACCWNGLDFNAKQQVEILYGPILTHRTHNIRCSIHSRWSSTVPSWPENLGSSCGSGLAVDLVHLVNVFMFWMQWSCFIKNQWQQTAVIICFDDLPAPPHPHTHTHPSSPRALSGASAYGLTCMRSRLWSPPWSACSQHPRPLCLFSPPGDVAVCWTDPPCPDPAAGPSPAPCRL